MNYEQLLSLTEANTKAIAELRASIAELRASTAEAHASMGATNLTLHTPAGS